MAFGRSKPDKGDTHDNEGITHHSSYVMNFDGTRSSTWIACYCNGAQPGGEHDGAVPAPPKPDAK